MFGSLGLPEILFILVLALLVFGPRRLPEVGRTIGRALGEFRRATGDLKRTFDQEASAFERDAGLDATAPRAPAAGPVPVDDSVPVSDSELPSGSENTPDAESGVVAEDEDEAADSKPS